MSRLSDPSDHPTAMPGRETRLVFKVHGMDCADEVAVLKREVGPLVGGEERLLFDLLAGRMTAEPVGTVDPVSIQEAVARTGMQAIPWEEGSSTMAWAGSRQRIQGVLAVISGLLTLVGFAVHAWLAGGVEAALGDEGVVGLPHAVPLGVRAIYVAAMLAGGWLIVPKALRAARRLRPDMKLLMTVAVAGAMGIGEWFEAATVTFLFALSLWLETWSVGRARRAVEALLDLSPETARVQRGGGEVEVPAAGVTVGEVFIVKPGERIPLDGHVVRGSSEVDQSPITGESVPAPKSEGNEVYAGTINGGGALEIRSTRAFGDTTLDRIVRMVEEARSRRAPSEMWVERFARVYTPLVMGLAILVLVVPPLAFGGPWSEWLYRSLVLLVIACPCALVISTPVSIVAGLAAAARNGVLIKGGAHLETPSRLKAVALDKTGTLTEGRPAVVEVLPLGGHDEAEVLRRAAALEARSEHPLARAVLRHAEGLGIRPTPVEGFQALRGKGATGRLDGRLLWIGSHRYLEERGQETPEVHDHLERMSGAGRTVVVVGNDTHVCGLIAMADEPRSGAAESVSLLKAAGVERVVMLTGDNEATARGLALRTGVDEARAELLPEDKVAAVEELVSRYGVVAMVGDGVNDAPAMARATLGIAMGAAGTDAAIETADVALMSDDLAKLPWLVAHSRRTLRIIRQNIAFSLAVKLVVFVLAVLGLASLWSAIAADMGASLLVIANGLRLLRPQAEPAG